MLAKAGSILHVLVGSRGLGTTIFLELSSNSGRRSGEANTLMMREEFLVLSDPGVIPVETGSGGDVVTSR